MGISNVALSTTDLQQLVAFASALLLLSPEGVFFHKSSTVDCTGICMHAFHDYLLQTPSTSPYTSPESMLEQHPATLQRGVLDFMAFLLGIVCSIRPASNRLTIQRPHQTLCLPHNFHHLHFNSACGS